MNLRQLIAEAVAAGLREAVATQDATPAARPRPNTSPPPPQAKFNLDHLKQLKTLADMQQYAKATLPFVGQGSARIVYKVDAIHALKLARDDRGVAQNKAETQVCHVSPELFAKIVATDPNDNWLLVEFADAMTPDKFKAVTGGLEWETYQKALNWAFKDMSHRDVPPDHEAAFNTARTNVFFQKLLAAAKGCDYMPGDLMKLDSWGVVGNKPVVIDAGFTRSVHAKFYQIGTAQTQVAQTQVQTTPPPATNVR